MADFLYLSIILLFFLTSYGFLFSLDWLMER